MVLCTECPIPLTVQRSVHLVVFKRIWMSTRVEMLKELSLLCQVTTCMDLGVNFIWYKII